MFNKKKALRLSAILGAAVISASCLTAPAFAASQPITGRVYIEMNPNLPASNDYFRNVNNRTTIRVGNNTYTTGGYSGTRVTTPANNNRVTVTVREGMEYINYYTTYSTRIKGTAVTIFGNYNGYNAAQWTRNGRTYTLRCSRYVNLNTIQQYIAKAMR